MKKVSMFLLVVLFIGLSGYESSAVVNKPTEVKVKLLPNHDVFTVSGQARIVAMLNGYHPCSGSCVCDMWRPMNPQNPNSGWARACGCYAGGPDSFWYEFKDCYYCPGYPTYGNLCQNG